jgi:hypothetical protein
MTVPRAAAAAPGGFDVVSNPAPESDMPSNDPNKPFKIEKTIKITENGEPFFDGALTWHRGTYEAVALIEKAEIDGLAGLNAVALEKAKV